MKGSWHLLKTKGNTPLGRSSHGLVTIGTNVYIFGGEHEPRVPIGSTIHRLDLKSLEWQECKPENEDCKPQPINAATVCAINEVIYIFGGRTGITMGEGGTNDMYSFNTKTNVWTKLQTTGDLPLPRSYHAMTSFDQKLYVFGGCGDEGRMKDLYSFDVTTNNWEKLPTHEGIIGRGGAGLVAAEGCIYVIAGFIGHEANDVHKFDITTKSWTTLEFKTSLPPRSVFGNSFDGKAVVVIGGEVDPSDKGHEGAGKFSNDCYVLDKDSPSEWKKLEVSGDVPEPRGWFPATYSNAEKMFVLFGGTPENNSRLNDIYTLRISYD